MRAIGYIRVSTKAQAGEDRYGVEAQRKAIERYCKESDIEIVKWLKDEITGVKESRPEFDRVLTGCYDKLADTVVVFKSDRIARDTKLYFYYLYLLERKGMKLISISEEFDEGSDMANIYRAILQFVAEQERKNIMIRTAAGRRVKASQGGFTGGIPPLGYFCMNNELAIDPREARIVKKIYKLSEEGLSVRKIAEALHEQGMHTREHKKFCAASVYNILQRREFYEGWTYVDGEKLKGRHKPILGKEAKKSED